MFWHQSCSMSHCCCHSQALCLSLISKFIPTLTLWIKWTTTQSEMSQNKWNNIKCGFAKTGKESVKEKKMADIQARKWNFTSNLLNRGSDFLKN